MSIIKCLMTISNTPATRKAKNYTNRLEQLPILKDYMERIYK